MRFSRRRWFHRVNFHCFSRATLKTVPPDVLKFLKASRKNGSVSFFSRLKVFLSINTLIRSALSKLRRQSSSKRATISFLLRIDKLTSRDNEDETHVELCQKFIEFANERRSSVDPADFHFVEFDGRFDRSIQTFNFVERVAVNRVRFDFRFILHFIFQSIEN